MFSKFINNTVNFVILWSMPILLFSCSQKNVVKEQEGHKYHTSPTSLVNPFFGSVKGNVLPGASVPFGLVKVSPDILPPQPTNGYRPGLPIAGFSHTHTSGTGGGPRYGNILVIPQTGLPDMKNYASVKNINERAFPGYYGVTLARVPGDVMAEVTATHNAGYHKYTFYTWDKQQQIQGNIFIDAAHTLSRLGIKDSRCLEAYAEILSDSIMQGWGKFSGGWGGQNPYQVYFYAVFSDPFDANGVWHDTILDQSSTLSHVIYDSTVPVKKRRMGTFATFDVMQNQAIEMSVGISFLSLNQAKENSTETSTYTLNGIYQKSDSLWGNYLSRIKVHGGLPSQQQVFYSALRNTFLMPSDVTGQTPGFSDSKVHYWDHYCLWDVFRTVMPLHTLITPDKQRAIIQSLLNIYEQRGWLPDAWIAGEYGYIQGGTNADVVIADAVVKNLGGFDTKKAFEAILKNSTIPSDNPEKFGRYIEEYAVHGYIPAGVVSGAVSRSLEYAYNDFCVAQVADKIGEKEIADKMYKQSMKIFSLFHDDARHFWAREKSGEWADNISTENLRKDHWNDPYFYEASPLAYSSYIPHNMAALISRHGGNEAYIQYLDRIFNSGFDLGNEPLFLLPYQYIYAGRHDKAAVILQDLMQNLFLPTPHGLPGQDDSGALSAWYVFSSMGIFPVAGQDVYLIGSPLFSRTEMTLEKDNKFTIIAHDLSDENIYVQKAALNGKDIQQAWLKHDQLISGGTLELFMGSEPSTWANANVPPSLEN